MFLVVFLFVPAACFEKIREMEKLLHIHRIIVTMRWWEWFWKEMLCYDVDDIWIGLVVERQGKILQDLCKEERVIFWYFQVLHCFLLSFLPVSEHCILVGKMHILVDKLYIWCGEKLSRYFCLWKIWQLSCVYWDDDDGFFAHPKPQPPTQSHDKERRADTLKMAFLTLPHFIKLETMFIKSIVELSIFVI